jgi:hypothetical protein
MLAAELYTIISPMVETMCGLATIFSPRHSVDLRLTKDGMEAMFPDHWKPDDVLRSGKTWVWPV